LYIRSAKKQTIPFEVYNDTNDITRDPQLVLEKWKTEFAHLYSFTDTDGGFNDDFYKECLDKLSDIEINAPVNYNLDYAIDVEEVRRVIRKSKLNKSIGSENLPNEIFKRGESDYMLTCLFNKIYETGITPSVWNLAIIKPIPKSGMLDAHLPLQYRGISLLSTVYKLYSSILNNRIISTAEENNIFVDEQNGFRPKRSCADHIFSLTSVIRNRNNKKISTYVAFVDLEKAFDRVDRNLLFFKLRSLGFGGKFYNTIKSIYSSPIASVNVNNFITDSFPSDFGVRQGDPLSPTLFGLFLNDLAIDIKNTGLGIKIQEDLLLSILLYADDLALIAESEQDLQIMITTLSNWCKKWRMKVNVKKTKVVHFRSKGVERTSFNFIHGIQTMWT
jgi:hypothetical protein